MSTEEIIRQAQESPDALLACILDTGEVLLTNGAEVFRVEDTLCRLCLAYGFSDINVFSITSSIVLTVKCVSGRIVTQTRRIGNRDTNLRKVEKINSLSRQLCKAPLRVADFQQRLEEISRLENPSILLQLFGYALVSASFSVFFGGNGWDGLAAALSGLFVFCIQYFLKKTRMNGILQCLLASAFTACVVVLLVRIGIGQAPDKITIGNIMLLIPGISFTTALRDMINGDTISGLIGISEAVIKAIAIAIGFAAVLAQFGGVL